jgi:flagellar biosynthesis protein FliP
MKRAFPYSLISAQSLFFFTILFLFVCTGVSFAQDVPVLPKVTFGLDRAQTTEDIAVTLEIVALMTVLTLAPSIIIMMTGFVRIVIVLNIVKRALGLMNAPPNQMIMGLSIFLTFFVMAPTFERINDEALQPYLAKDIDYQQGVDAAIAPLKEFMLRQTGEKELALFLRTTKRKNPKTVDDLSMVIIIPAFIVSELKTSFIIGFLVYIPFLIIDMVIATILMSMGMMMLPPMMVSLPIKLILFVMVDGWNLIIQQTVLSFK